MCRRLLFPLCVVAAFSISGQGVDEAAATPFRSEEGKFSIAFPNKPTKQTSKVQTPRGELESHAFIVAERDKAYGVNFGDYQKGLVTDLNRQSTLDGARDGAAKKLNAKVISESKITVGKAKLAGRELIATLSAPKDTFIRMRIVLSGDRLYSYMVVGSKEWVEGAEATKYLDSFVIHE